MPDGDAFAERLYARHSRGLLRLAVHLAGGDWHQGEDLAQEAMLRAWRHRKEIRPGQERAWLAATARNLAIDGYRRDQARHAREARYASLVVLADDPAARVADTVTVRAAVAALPPGRRAVIAELYYAGRSIAETAVALGIPPGTVKSRANHALAALRPALAARPAPAGVASTGRAAR
jgi:RNA polymerase sigma-70 factor (ECF subfamily)